MWKFKPILKQTIWGGRRIASLKGLDTDLDRVGESWEISGMPGSESVVESGPDEGLTLTELIEKYDADLLGKRIYKRFGTSFPLLVKFINALDDLSVQVHPDDELAAQQGHPCGKTEMWVVAEARPGAKIANGFRRPVEREEYDGLIASGQIEKVLNYIDISTGEIYYIPSGRVHAICGECLILEIQQSSDLTYRIYDYNRTDADGRRRELHTELARMAINFNDTDGRKVEYRHIENVPVNVIQSHYFCTNLLRADTELMRDYSERDSFVILVCLDGEAEITSGSERQRLSAGRTLLVPALSRGVTITPKTEVTLIETYIA